MLAHGGGEEHDEQAYLPISPYISLCISLYLDAHGGGEETDENEHEDDRQAHPHAEADPADVVLGLVAHGLRDGVLALRVDGVGVRGRGRVRLRGRVRVRVRVWVRVRVRVRVSRVIGACG